MEIQWLLFQFLGNSYSLFIWFEIFGYWQVSFSEAIIFWKVCFTFCSWTLVPIYIFRFVLTVLFNLLYSLAYSSVYHVCHAPNDQTKFLECENKTITEISWSILITNMMDDCWMIIWLLLQMHLQRAEAPVMKCCWIISESDRGLRSKDPADWIRDVFKWI